MTIYRCSQCKSENVCQEISFMVNLNTWVDGDRDSLDISSADFFFCLTCMEECSIDEIDPDDDMSHCEDH